MEYYYRKQDTCTYQPIDSAKVESYYNARYLGEFCIKNKDRRWTDFPVAVFYQPNPDIEKGHTNYFGIYVGSDNKVYITDASSAFSEPMEGIALQTGEVLISRYTHDYNSDPSGSIAIDGGRSYTRIVGNGEFTRVLLTNKDGEFIITPA